MGAALNNLRNVDLFLRNRITDDESHTRRWRNRPPVLYEDKRWFSKCILGPWGSNLVAEPTHAGSNRLLNDRKLISSSIPYRRMG